MFRKKNTTPRLDHPALHLRDNAHEVRIIIPNGTTQPVLGMRHPGDDDVRASSVAHFGGSRPSPRQSTPAAVELPLPQRTQTVLTHQLPRARQQLLDSGSGTLTDSRQQHQDGCVEKLISPT